MLKRASDPRGRAAPSVKVKKQARQSSQTGEAARNYDHDVATAPLRPDVGVQKQIRKKKPSKTYRYDPSLGLSLQWDEQPARERSEVLLGRIQGAGSQEEVRLVVHERLSTRAILDALQAHACGRRSAQ